MGAAEGRSGGGLGKANAIPFSLSLALALACMGCPPRAQGAGGSRPGLRLARRVSQKLVSRVTGERGHWGSCTWLCSWERHHSVLQLGGQGKWAVGAVSPP